ncbi:3-octaprenyl-4-hydroxybenzoate carboxy-lyase, partial [Vibrio sp. 10N.222.49.C9]
TKYVLVCDESVDARDWNQVVAAMTEHMQPKRDIVMIENTPIDSLDFASPVAGLGSKMGLDATIKWPAELAMSKEGSSTPLPALQQEKAEQLFDALKQQFPFIKDCYLPT